MIASGMPVPHPHSGRPDRVQPPALVLVQTVPGRLWSGRPFSVRPVADDQWVIVAWLWQQFRHDLAPIINGLPYADGRYQAAQLQRVPAPDGGGAWPGGLIPIPARMRRRGSR